MILTPDQFLFNSYGSPYENLPLEVTTPNDADGGTVPVLTLGGTVTVPVGAPSSTWELRIAVAPVVAGTQLPIDPWWVASNGEGLTFDELPSSGGLIACKRSNRNIEYEQAFPDSVQTITGTGTTVLDEITFDVDELLTWAKGYLLWEYNCDESDVESYEEIPDDSYRLLQSVAIYVGFAYTDEGSYTPVGDTISLLGVDLIGNNQAELTTTSVRCQHSTGLTFQIQDTTEEDSVADPTAAPYYMSDMSGTQLEVQVRDAVSGDALVISSETDTTIRTLLPNQLTETNPLVSVDMSDHSNRHIRAFLRRSWRITNWDGSPYTDDTGWVQSSVNPYTHTIPGSGTIQLTEDQGCAGGDRTFVVTVPAHQDADTRPVTGGAYALFANAYNPATGAFTSKYNSGQQEARTFTVTLADAYCNETLLFGYKLYNDNGDHHTVVRNVVLFNQGVRDDGFYRAMLTSAEITSSSTEVDITDPVVMSLPDSLECSISGITQEGVEGPLDTTLVYLVNVDDWADASLGDPFAEALLGGNPAGNAATPEDVIEYLTTYEVRTTLAPGTSPRILDQGSGDTITLPAASSYYKTKELPATDNVAELAFSADEEGTYLVLYTVTSSDGVQYAAWGALQVNIVAASVASSGTLGTPAAISGKLLVTYTPPETNEAIDAVIAYGINGSGLWNTLRIGNISQEGIQDYPISGIDESEEYAVKAMATGPGMLNGIYTAAQTVTTPPPEPTGIVSSIVPVGVDTPALWKWQVNIAFDSYYTQNSDGKHSVYVYAQGGSTPLVSKTAETAASFTLALPEYMQNIEAPSLEFRVVFTNTVTELTNTNSDVRYPIETQPDEQPTYHRIPLPALDSPCNIRESWRVHLNNAKLHAHTYSPHGEYLTTRTVPSPYYRIALDVDELLVDHDPKTIRYFLTIPGHGKEIEIVPRNRIRTQDLPVVVNINSLLRMYERVRLPQEAFVDMQGYPRTVTLRIVLNRPASHPYATPLLRGFTLYAETNEALPVGSGDGIPANPLREYENGTEDYIPQSLLPSDDPVRVAVKTRKALEEGELGANVLDGNFESSSSWESSSS